MKKKEDKKEEKTNTIPEKKRKVMNRNFIGCPICQNPDISKIVDPLIFSCSSTRNEMIANLENQGIFIDDDVFRDHVTHIFSIDEDEENNLIELLKTPKNATNLDIVERTLNQIESAITSMILSGESKTKEYNEMIRRKQEWLSLRAKLQGEMVDKVEMSIPEWIRKVPVIDAEIVQPQLLETTL